MNPDNTESTATTDTVSLDDFAQELFGTTKVEPKPVQDEAPVNEGADDTSTSDADDTKPEDTTTEADPESNTGDDDSGEPPVEKPKKKTAAERISEIVAERNAEREANAALRARLDALEASKAETKEPTTPAAAPEDAAPNPDDLLEDGSLKYPLGEYDAQFLSDRVDYLFAKKEVEAEARKRETEARDTAVNARTTLQTEWETKLQAVEATEEMADIREVGAVMISEIQEIVDEKYGDFLATTIMQMEQGPEVFYFLANNTDIAKEIASKDAVNAIIALGALQERFRSTENPDTGNPKPRVSKAPEPPKNVNRGNQGRFETPDDTDDLDAFARKLFKK